MLNVPDLSVLARYDTYGPLVIRAITSRFLHLEIFSMGLAGIFPQPEGMFDNDFLTRPGVDPARSELERRRWHQLLYSGLIAHPTFANLRRNREQNLANDLNQLFSFLYPNESHYQRLLSEIIEPAMELKLRIANTVNEHKFLFFSTPIPMEITPEFLSQFGHLARESLTGKDVADPTKKIVFENTNQASIANGCLPICSISPIITYRDVDVDPADVDLTSRGKIVCVRGTPEERQAILDNIIPGPFYIIFSSPSGSQSGSQSGQATQ
ncbi:hypothetical protein F5Y02DRAFT_385463 [Annulohypoxylon stygium]|nr:hypothetical protein F5Y02DRAFT_385463 [Annulohypoxylon stygium]